MFICLITFTITTQNFILLKALFLVNVVNIKPATKLRLQMRNDLFA